MASKKLQKYFENLENETTRTLKIANNARAKGFDPEDKVDIPIAKNMAERVIGLISAVAPQMQDSNVVPRIVELESEYSPLDWRVGFRIAGEVAQERFCKFKDRKEAIEIGIRTGFTYLTGGIVSAPLEGFVEAKIKKTHDGKEYIACFYAGPIRGAGGTAAALSVVLSDYVATTLGYAKYDPTEGEINRAVTELYDYHDRITNLQYLPSEEEIKFMVKHLPLEVDGDPTERIEISNYKDQPRIETNLIRGGICLVIGEGLCQKAPKLWKRLSIWGKDLGIDWTFLKDFLDLQKKVKARGAKKKESKGISPNYTFINDMVAGRPVLTYPMAYGGFRIRMGRTRTSGFSCVGINPLTLSTLDNFIVYGTQLKIERPGKASSVTVCECVDGPTVLLEDDSVVRITKENKDMIRRVKKILFLGDMLINYGDFSENGHSLVPLGYCEEWWVQELEKKVIDLSGIVDVHKLSSVVDIPEERLSQLLDDFFHHKPTFNEALSLSIKLGLPLHPEYIYFYTSMSKDDLKSILLSFQSAKFNYYDDTQTDKLKSIVINFSERIKIILENAGIPHLLMSTEFIVIQDNVANSIAHTFQLLNPADKALHENLILKYPDKTVLELINILSDVEIRDKAGTFVGARMGRPEKAKMRKLQGSPQVLFPVGDEGGRLKSFQSSIEKGEVTSSFPLYYCESCKKKTIYKNCHLCGGKSRRLYFCPNVNKEIMADSAPLQIDEGAKTYKTMTISIKEYVDSSLKILNSKVYPDLIKGVKGTSNKDHIPEHLIKGFLRAKYEIYVNKDGTTRYDMSETPLTAFKPKEIGTTIEKLKDLGYTHDINGEKLEHHDQVVELFPQDVVVPAGENALEEQADDVMFKTGNFVDELLVRLYNQKKYYNFNSKQDIVGSLIICLAPHISCGTIGRVIGFSKNQVMAAHPMMHAAVRRDCDGDEACFIMLMDAFLNFSRQYLPDKRGTRTMDAPLVLSTKIIPSEVDDQVHGLDVVKRYPLDLYKAAQEFKMPWDVKVEQLKDRLNTEKQYEGFHSTHPVGNINTGPKISAYKVLPSMKEKLDGQMNLAKKIRAVNASNVATMVIQKHFLKDIKGNLRKFSLQQFRCVQCNSKFDRPPLIGKCSKCGGKLLFTISEGSVVKYLGPSVELAENFNVPAYLKQTIELTQERVDSVFGKEKEIQEGLAKFI
ncbi:DNA polymerase II large subunit [Candidatus Woesearchaeota archaeon]|nr:DNA polymerase II large subunit [Candidatus Woesearchaeota archaeon]